MLLSTLRALDALAELGAAEHEDWDKTGDTVPSSPCPDDDAAARARLQVLKEFAKFSVRIERLRAKCDAEDAMLEDLEKRTQTSKVIQQVARCKEAIARYLLEMQSMQAEYNAVRARWTKLHERRPVKSKLPRAFVGIQKAAGYEMQNPVVDEAARLRQQVEATRARRAQNCRQQIALMQEQITDITGEIAAWQLVTEQSNDVRACISMLEREKQECMERSTALTQLLVAITQ